jgi:chemotaxis protein methyltransferase CheR
MGNESSNQKLVAAPVDEAILWRLSVMVRDRMGLNYGSENMADLERGVRRAAGEFGFHGGAAANCAEWLVSSPISNEQIDILARYLTIGETYFFRDPALFEALRLHVWPALLQLRRATGERELRIWSAACCSGEEPYSIAMQLHALLPQLLPDWRSWKITILATDLNPAFLKKAESATYSAWSFRSAARDEQKLYFNPTADGRFQLKPEIRRYVKFARLNLVSDLYPAILNGTAQQDIIFCRNVLMYFGPDQVRTVAANLIRCLNDGGYLVPAASEASPATFAPLMTAPLPGVIIYKKTTAPPVVRRQETRVATNEDAARPARALSVEPRPKAKPKAAAPPKNVSRTPVETTPSAGTRSADEWHSKAREAAGSGRLAEALGFCDEAIKAGKMAARHYYLRASILLETSPDGDAPEDANEREAEAALPRALYLEPDFALAHFVLGNLERRRGRADSARRAWQNALQVLQNLPPDAELDDGDELTAGHAAVLIERALQTLDSP